MIDFNVNVDGVDVLDRTLVRFTERADDLSEPLDEMGDVVARLQAREFATEGRETRGGWAALSPDYRQRKARTHPGKPILERDGDLKRSLTRRPFGVDEVSRHVAVFGTDIPYARYHMDGTPFMPARPPLIGEVGKGPSREFVKILQRWVVEGVAA